MDDEHEIDWEASEEGLEPEYRATIRNGTVLLTHWAPWLVAGGVWNELLAARKRAGVAIADLTLTGRNETELLVTFLSRGRDPAAAEDALCDWAHQVGYRRVWLPDRLVTLDASPDPFAHAEVRCRIWSLRCSPDSLSENAGGTRSALSAPFRNLGSPKRKRICPTLSSVARRWSKA